MAVPNRRLPVLIFILLVAASCATRQPAPVGAAAPPIAGAAVTEPNPPTPIPASCSQDGTGVVDPKAPVVCVSTAPLRVDPEPVRVYRTVEKVPVTVRWVSRKTSDSLTVRLADGDCLSTAPVQNTYYYDAPVSGAHAGTGPQQCKYIVTLNGQTLDPVIVVDDNPVNP